MRTAAITVTCITLLLSSHLPAQGPQAFEVASIRKNVSGDQRGGGLAGPQPGGRFVGVGVTLRRLVVDAYDGVEVVGGPSWMDRDRFDINARGEGTLSATDIRRMLRPLLAERFNLLVHTESREAAIYELRVARADGQLGPTLRPSAASCANEARSFFPGGAPSVTPACGDFRMGARALTARGMTMGALARLLTGRVGRPVVDRTGRDVAFDLEVQWFSDVGLEQAPPEAAGADQLTSDGVSLFTALQEQLGLRLQTARGAVEVLVVDRAEPPTPD